MTESLYEADYYAWTLRQAELLRDGNLAEADLQHLAEEIEDMGRSLKRELESRLKVLLAHLHKWQYQPGYRGNSWRYSIEEQRNELSDHLQDNPSLRAKLPEALARGYRNALTLAARETGLTKDRFPSGCPWTLEQVLDPDFWPEDEAV
jgi:hypothetical protein